MPARLLTFQLRALTEHSWYQTLPGPKLDILPASLRLPRRIEVAHPSQDEGAMAPELDEVRKNMIKQRQERLDAFVVDKKKWLERRAVDSRERARKNVEYAADVRRRFLEGVTTSDS